MEKKVYCLMNHELTDVQKNELEKNWNCKDVVYPSKELSGNWSQVSTDSVVDRGLVEKVIGWMSESEEGDCLVVQGEMGSTFMVVDWALGRGLVPLHAVSKRESVEEKNGETVVKRNVFSHVCFRRYERW